MITDPKNLLNQINPFIKDRVIEFLTAIETKLFLDLIINCVYDSYEDGVNLNKQNPLNPIFSFHTFGVAVDFNAVKDSDTKNERVFHKADSVEDWESTGVPQLAKSLNIRWGGLFGINNPDPKKRYKDCVHFDWALLFGDNVYEVLNKMIIAAKSQFGEDLAKEQELNKLDLTKL